MVQTSRASPCVVGGLESIPSEWLEVPPKEATICKWLFQDRDCSINGGFNICKMACICMTLRKTPKTDTKTTTVPFLYMKPKGVGVEHYLLVTIC